MAASGWRAYDLSVNNFLNLMIMKMYLKLAFTIIFLAVFAFRSNAQESIPAFNSPKPAWIPENGYWIVESNIKTPKHAIVYFYSDDDIMIYKEEIEGIKLNLKKEKTKMKLKKLLESALWAWEAKKPINETAKIVNFSFSH